MAQQQTPKNTSDKKKEAVEVNAYDVTNSDQWTHYAKYRPKYPPQLFQRVYDYHDEAGGQYNTAHDAGCGPGVTAAVLAQKFKHIFCSDFSAQAVESARHNLTTSSTKRTESKTEFTFKQSTAEDMSWIAPGSVDLVAMSECLHWTETSKTLATANQTLKPGGTFAAWYYCDPHFPELPPAQALYDEVLQHWVKLRADWSEVSQRTLWVENTGYDCIGFPESQGWERGSVRRVKFNTQGSGAVFERVHDKRWMKYPSQIGEDETLEYVEDAEEWQLQGGVEWCRGWFESMHPKLAPEYLEPRLQRLEEILGGPEATTKVSWPVVLVLARKQRT